MYTLREGAILAAKLTLSIKPAFEQKPRYAS
jgi:hypothetical protein